MVCAAALENRADVDPARIGVCGSSLGGHYAARAGCYEKRLVAESSHGAIWSVHDMSGTKGDDFGLAMHIRRVLVQQPDGKQAGQMIWSR
jgi:acetyl esterase/lipase